MMMKNRIGTLLFALSAVLLILTFSIGLPIYVRPFYYTQIEPLALPEKTGYTEEEIREAYDQVLDYLTLPGKEFGTGVFAHSEEGKSHFEDCKVLFDFNAILFLSALVIQIGLYLLRRKRRFVLSRPFGFHVLFTAGGAVLFLFVTLALVISFDFDTAFEVFHHLFFPGKTNWVFSAYHDPIILALPETFFMRCAILIGGSVILLSICCVVFGVLEKRFSRKK